MNPLSKKKKKKNATQKEAGIAVVQLMLKLYAMCHDPTSNQVYRTH